MYTLYYVPEYARSCTLNTFMYTMLMIVTGCTHHCTQDGGMHIRGIERDQ